MKTKITLNVLVLLFACFTLNAFNSPTNEISENTMVEDTSETVNLNGFLFEFLGVQYNLDGTSDWTYRVTGAGARHDLSHWKLKLSDDQVVTSSSPNTWEVHVDPHFHYYGIKWDSKVRKNGGTKTFSFKLNGRYDVGESDFGYKAARKLYHGRVAGPSIPSTNSISGRMFNDTNANGVKDGVEGYLSEVQLILYDDANGNGILDAGEVVLESQITDGAGEYLFVDIDVSNVIIEAMVPSNTMEYSYESTTALRTSVALISDDITDVNFGIKRTQLIFYNISGVVYDDDNANGINESEAGLNAVTVNMFNDANANGVLEAGEALIATTTTDSAGAYVFTQVAYNDVIVEVAVPANTINFNYTATTSTQDAITTLNQNITDADFGINQESASYAISGNVFNDVNADGDNTSDGGLNNMTVRLYHDVDGNGVIGRGEPLINTTVSDRNGNYQFTGVTNVFVVVQVVVPSNTSQYQYVATTSINVALSSGTTANNVNFGIQRTTIILYNVRGLVWQDENADQVQDATETRLEGISVTLYQDVNANGIIEAGDTAINTVYTSSTGTYEFMNVDSNNVIVEPVLPSNGTYTTLGSRAVSSANTDVNNIDFGMQITESLYEIKGVVFDDDNENGLPDAGERSLEGLTVEIYVDTDNSGTLDTNLDTLVAFAQTSNGGLDFTNPNYVIASVPSGEVFIKIVVPTATVFESWTPTFDPDSGTAGPDGVFRTIMTGNIAEINFGINYVNLAATSRDANVDDVLFTDENTIDAAPEDVSERLRLYPNPTVSQFAINAEEFAGDVTVSIYNDRGYKVMTTTVSPFGNEVNVDVQRLAPGMYYAKFASRNKVASKKFIKK